MDTASHQNRTDGRVSRRRPGAGRIGLRCGEPVALAYFDVLIAATADLHGHLPAIPDCDLLLIAGDITPAVSHDVDFQAQWLDHEFRRWLEAVPATHVVGIAGNHDFVFQRAADRVPADLPWIYLEDDDAVIDGVRFWGSPWTPWFYNWAFNAPDNDPDEEFLKRHYEQAPDEADVLVVHGPPAGYGDRTTVGESVRSWAFLAALDRVKPTLAVFGHIHEDRGVWTRGGTTLANVSAVDRLYELTGEPIRTFVI